ncbi:MAG: polysaccharide biosynthesis/export family protein [Deltaproteobacteria bacterium]|nr:polysaccharide biosynthesis/export family protein [Deltaproteobacteria bacterium]
MACKLLSAASALILAVGIYGCALEEPARPSMEQRRIPQLAEYRIGPDDELLVTVWKDETLTRTVPVRPDGMISLPLLNDVQAAGLTPAELREVLKKKLMPYMSDPQVSVIVQKVSSFKVSVMGEVKKPGSYEITGQNTVLDALSVSPSTITGQSRTERTYTSGPETSLSCPDAG